MSPKHTSQAHSLFILLKTVLLLSILSLSRANSACPSSAYVSASDASSYASKICATAVANTQYRIQGGASLSCSGGVPSVTSSDPNVLTKALCIKITTTPGGSPSSTSDIPVKKTIPPGCPENYIQATYQQALTYQNEICSALGDWDIVELQGGGSIRGRSYYCVITETETASMGDIACVPLTFFGPVTTVTVSIANANENVCSSCQSLITTTEASTYYTSIPVGTTARIAGGSSVQRTSDSAFIILDHDTTSQSSKICASMPRAGCPTSSYMTSSCTCETCLTSCHTCSGPSSCDSCSAVTGFPFNYNLLCYNPCPTSTFESSSATCDDCSSNCLTCTGDADYCTSCSSPTPFLYENKCFANCPSGTYTASSSTCQDCASPCKTCFSTDTTCTTCLSDFPNFLNDYCYETCPDGYYSDPATNICLPCSNDCTTCADAADKCTSCSSLTSTPFLYENKCFARCPTGSFLSSPDVCSSKSRSGNLPSHVETSFVLPKITRVLSITTNIGFTVGAAFSSGPTAIFTGLLFKLIGYIKYLDIDYPNNLEQAFPKWQSDIIPSVFPHMSQNTRNKLEAKSIPAIFLERKIAPTFLENFWLSMLNLAISFFAFGCIFLTAASCKQKEKKKAELILKYLLTGLVNFIIVQLYYHCGDILLFFILEARSAGFTSGLSVVSLCISIIFLSIALCALALHSFLLVKYSKAHKNKKTSEFEEKYSHFKILYEAFKGSSFLSSSYLLLFTLRDVALNLVIALFFKHTLAQAILFICICVAFMGYLIVMQPFKRTMENIGQYFFEALVILTYIAALVIRTSDGKTRDRLGMLIIVMAFIFSVVSTTLMIFTLLRMSRRFSQELAQRKAERKIHVLSETRQNINIVMSPSPIKDSTFIESADSPRDLDISPVRLDKNETIPATEPSFTNNLSLAERIQLRTSQDNQREKNQLKLFKNNFLANEQGKARLQPDQSVIQEESDQTSQSLPGVKCDKPETSPLYTNQSQSRRSNLSSHSNSINLISYTKLQSNTDSPENRSSKFNNDFRDPTFTDSRVLHFPPDKDLPPIENQF